MKDDISFEMLKINPMTSKQSFNNSKKSHSHRFLIAISFAMLLPFTSFCAQDFQSKYLYGKDLYKAGKYEPAMEILLPLTKEAPGNAFVEYSHYYYSLAGLKAGRLSEAYQMLLQLTQKYPNWENIDEAYYLEANVAFEQKKYRYGLNFLKNIGTRLEKDADGLKENYFTKLFPIDSLKAIQQSYPNDATLARVLYNRISSGPASEKDQMLANYLAQEFKISPSAPVATRKTVVKPEYNVAVLFPFMVNEIGVEGVPRTNTYALEMYQGIQKAADSLKGKVKINLFAYDTEKDAVKITEILKLPELAAMDMIIGPLVASQNAPVSDFAAANALLVVNPISNNSKLIDNNDYVFLLQPTLERQAQQVANFVETTFPLTEKDSVYIFYGDNIRDSIAATSYRDSISKRNYKVILFEEISKDKLANLSLSLSDSAAVSSVNHVYIASADQMIAANAISALEKTKIVTPVFTRSEWLQFPLINFAQLQKRQVHFIYPDFIDLEKPTTSWLKQYYINQMHTFPTSYFYTGYEAMSFFGKALGQYGNNFREGLMKQGFTKGNIFSGFDYTSSDDNQFVPIVKFEDDKLKILNYRQK